MAIIFVFNNIVFKASDWLVKIFEGMSSGKGIKESINETIEQATPEELEKERIKQEEEAKRIVEKQIAKIKAKEDKEKGLRITIR